MGSLSPFSGGKGEKKLGSEVSTYILASSETLPRGLAPECVAHSTEIPGDGFGYRDPTFVW